MTRLSLIEYLRSFNRKERLFLLGQAIGAPSFLVDQASFRLCDRFRKELAGVLGGLEIPRDAFVAMDYHLDWLAVSLYLASGRSADRDLHSNAAGLVTGNQEDVDLLIAFEMGTTTRLILIEAKGDSSWSTRQMRSKAKRLRQILGAPEDLGVEPSFVLMSPNRPQRLEVSDRPGWMKSGSAGDWNWLPLEMAEGARYVTRCHDPERPTDEWTHFRVT